MQQIERYGVIALLFLLVTIVVVALWDGGEAAQASEGDKVAQVEDKRVQAPAKNQTTRPKRGTRPQSQAPSQNAASLNRGQDNRNNLSQRQRLINPGGVPGDPNARGTTRNQRANARPGSRANQRPGRTLAPKTNADALAKVQAQYQSEPRRPRDTSQWTRNSNVAANTPNIPREQVPAIRNIQAQKPVTQRTQRQPVKTRPASVQGPIYVIKAGDSLERIARATLGDGTRWREIQKLNGMKNTTVVVGKKLRLPLGADSTSMSPTAAKQQARDISRTASANAGPAPGSSAGTYVIQSGDYLGKIAEKELGTSTRWKEIVELNPGLNPKRLVVGKRIQMPVAGKVAKRSSKPQGRAVAKADTRYTVH